MSREGFEAAAQQDAELSRRTNRLLGQWRPCAEAFRADIRDFQAQLQTGYRAATADILTALRKAQEQLGNAEEALTTIEMQCSAAEAELKNAQTAHTSAQRSWDDGAADRATFENMEAQALQTSMGNEGAAGYARALRAEYREQKRG